MADDLRYVANNVTVGIVPNSGHWIMEENPQATIRLVNEFRGKMNESIDAHRRLDREVTTFLRIQGFIWH
jgi:hypothetical protein